MSEVCLKTAALFSDNMVLQRGAPICVWGWDKPGGTVTVELGGNAADGRAGQDGRWDVELPALEAGGPLEMTVAGSDTRKFRNVMVGEVWLCSGQSNMQWAVRDSADPANEIAAAQYPAIRLFTVPNAAKVEPRPDITGEWVECSPRTIPAFSAAAYYFGRELYRELKIPIGLINTSWGGTRIEAWMSREALMRESSARKDLLEYRRFLEEPGAAEEIYRQRMEEYNSWAGRFLPKDPGNTAFAAGWADPAVDTAGWEEMAVPQYWQRAGLNFSGVVWFRRDVEVPAELAGQDLTLHLGPCDKTDITYFNNVEVGRIGLDTPEHWAVPRAYTVPGRLVRAGRNTVAVRIMSHCYAGGFAGHADDLYLAPADGRRICLDGPWRYKVEHNFGSVQVPPAPPQPYGNGNPNSPHILYDNMIAPLAPCGARGAIWYQGESNAENPPAYRVLLREWIKDWRSAWRKDDLEFLVVQLPNYLSRQAEPGESKWAEIREGELAVLALPHTGVAVTIDIGDPMDIHPKNKQDVGRRLALWALGTCYGRKMVYSGPLYRSHAVEQGRIRVRFDHVGGGLTARGGKLEGFAVAGADGRFVWAEAVIEGDSIVVSSARVPKPTAVRYAWADNPACNLYNSERLPASPFRTDQP